MDKKITPLMNAMTSSADLLLTSSQETKSLLFIAASKVGRINDLMNGTVLQTKKGIKDMAGGLEGILKQFGVDGIDAVDQLSDEAKKNLNLQLHAAFGIDLGDLRSVVQSLRESGKGLVDRLADINKERQKNLTLEEKATLMEKERALKRLLLCPY